MKFLPAAMWRLKVSRPTSHSYQAHFQLPPAPNLTPTGVSSLLGDRSSSPLSCAATWLPLDHSLLKQTNPGGGGGGSGAAALHGAKVSSTLFNVQEISPARGRTPRGRKGRAEPAAGTPRELNGCARVRPWEVRLPKEAT